jgi:uncharacterized protein (DUF4415 family)
MGRSRLDGTGGSVRRPRYWIPSTRAAVETRRVLATEDICPYTVAVRSAAEKYRNIDFAGARRGAVVRPDPGKTKISIRLDNAVLEHFRKLVDKAGAGNYQTLVNDALLEHIHRRSTLDVVRAVVREELAPYRVVEALRRKLPRKGNGPGARRRR